MSNKNNNAICCAITQAIKLRTGIRGNAVIMYIYQLHFYVSKRRMKGEISFSNLKCVPEPFS